MIWSPFAGAVIALLPGASANYVRRRARCPSICSGKLRALLAVDLRERVHLLWHKLPRHRAHLVSTYFREGHDPLAQAARIDRSRALTEQAVSQPPSMGATFRHTDQPSCHPRRADSMIGRAGVRCLCIKRRPPVARDHLQLRGMLTSLQGWPCPGPKRSLGRAYVVIEYALAIYAEGDRSERQVDGDQAQRPMDAHNRKKNRCPSGHALTTGNTLWTNG
jgi:hypothetical protein